MDLDRRKLILHKLEDMVEESLDYHKNSLAMENMPFLGPKSGSVFGGRGSSVHRLCTYVSPWTMADCNSS